MSLPSELAAALGNALGAEVLAAERVGGGSINDAWRVELSPGPDAFLKARGDARAAEFEAEAAGLSWLAEADGGASLPEVLGVGEDPAWLALEWVAPGVLAAAGAEELGRGLATLHRAGASAHGALPPGSPDDRLRIGSVELAIRERERWANAYAEDMLMPLVERARDRGSLTAPDAEAVESVCARIGDLAGPEESPSRLHGDLWGGNVHSDANGAGWLIDPAAHGGHREVDLAMLRLFGAPSEIVFSAYAESHPLSDGHAERVALWQLLPLLVHAVLFGASYGARAGAAARRYT